MKIALNNSYQTKYDAEKIPAGSIGTCLEYSYDDFSQQTICLLSFPEGNYYYLDSQLKKPEPKIEQIVTYVDNEFSGPCRGTYSYDLDALNKALHKELQKRQLTTASEKRDSFINYWLSDNTSRFMKHFNITRSDMNCNSLVFETETKNYEFK